MNIHIVIPVWGGHYLDLLEEVCLPTLLAPGNIPALQLNHHCRVRILTKKEDVARLKDSDIFCSVQKVCQAEIIDSSFSTGGKMKYAEMNACVSHAYDTAEEEQAAIVFGLADFVWSDGMLATAIAHLAEGKRAVLAPCFRVISDKFRSDFAIKINPEQRMGAISIPPRSLASLAMDNIHPYSATSFWGEPTFHDWPFLIHWAVKGEGMMIRGFHLHPVIIHPEVYQADYDGEIDGEFVFKACPTPENIVVIQDSDDGIFVSLDNFSRASLNLKDHESERAALIDTALWARSHVHEMHLNLLKLPCRIHGSEISSNVWSQIERESQIVVDKILFAHKLIKLIEELVSKNLHAAAKRLSAAFFTTNLIEEIKVVDLEPILMDQDCDVEDIKKLIAKVY